MSVEFPSFLSSTARRNHQLIDSAIGHTREFLSTPQIATALGQQTGYLVGLMDRVIVPNVRHGKVEMPEDAPENAFPVIVLGSSEQLIIESSRLAPNQIQQSSVERKVKSPGIAQDLHQIFLDRLSHPWTFAIGKTFWQVQVMHLLQLP